jgi:hypothetical protein
MIDFAKMPSAKTSKAGRARRPRTARKQCTPTWHAGYLQMLPAIRRQARRRLGRLSGEAREDAFQEILADTVVAYARLAELGREDLAYPTPLVTYAVKKLRAGRRVGNRLNVRDVTSEQCQRRQRFVVERIDRLSKNSGEWREVLVEDRHASPAEIAAIRVDFCDWLNSLSLRDRRIAEQLAIGETSGRVARMFAVSTGRISQLRRELLRSWSEFTGSFGVAEVCVN